MFGIKILLVLHVFAVALLITQPKNPKRARMMTGTLISGLIILESRLISGASSKLKR